MKQDLKVGIITQARMSSSRLPGKILIKIKGKPIIKYHTDRLKVCGLPIFIATTINNADDSVADYSHEEGFFLYRGSEDNVLSRYYECAKIYELDIIIRVTSDCPLIDGNLIKHALNDYLRFDDEYIYYSNCLERRFPRGFDFEIFSFKLLEDAYINGDLSEEKEHVTPYINKNRSGKVKIKDFIQEENLSRFRITLDTPEDLQLIKILLEDHQAEKLSHSEISTLLKRHPDLYRINSSVEQKKN